MSRRLINLIDVISASAGFRTTTTLCQQQRGTDYQQEQAEFIYLLTFHIYIFAGSLRALIDNVVYAEL
jgi:hypothetical protein